MKCNKEKKGLSILSAVSFFALFVITLILPMEAMASRPVPSVIKGYVGDCYDIEAKYGITIDRIGNENIYYDGDFIHAGNTRFTYWDDNDNYKASTISVRYSPALRLIADEWWYDWKYYSIRVYNISSKSVTFTTAKADYYYKNHSRQNCKFKLAKAVTIKPGKGAVLRFKRVSGGKYYMPSTNLACMQMKCKHGGKTYTIRNVHGTCNFYRKAGSKWAFIDYKGDYDFF